MIEGQKSCRTRDEILDLVRGLSALMVLVAHVRGFVMVDLGEVSHPNLWTKVLYFGTSLHHQAVMVFFVLSGYFVGGSVVASLRRARFSLSHYALARLSRLWVALVPALLLTLALDVAGRSMNPAAYSGRFRDIFMSGPELAIATGPTLLTFLGNLVFLQTVAVPVFGSNGPLWSLANEFWYYVLFPLLALTFLPSRRSAISRVAFAVLFMVLVSWLPWGLVSMGAIWLFGVGVWWIAQRARAREVTRSLGWAIATAVLFAATLAASKTGSWLGTDFAVGLAFAAWMLSLLGPWGRQGWWSRAGSGLSAISYTLYVVHFPLLFFVVTAGLQGKQFQPTMVGLAWLAGLTVLSLAVAVVMWWLFERRTDELRRCVSVKFLEDSIR